MSLTQSKTTYRTVPSTAKVPAVKTFSLGEVSQHNKEGDLWIIIDTAVYVRFSASISEISNVD